MPDISIGLTYEVAQELWYQLDDLDHKDSMVSLFIMELEAALRKYEKAHASEQPHDLQR